MLLLFTFSQSADVDALKVRVTSNVTVYYVNYTLLILAVAALVLLFNPWSLIIVTLAVAANFYVMTLPESVRAPNGQLFPRKQVQMVSGLATGLVTLILAGFTILFAFGLGVSLVAVHAIAHSGAKFSVDAGSSPVHSAV